jgi:hypothetical protein
MSPIQNLLQKSEQIDVEDSFQTPSSPGHLPTAISSDERVSPDARGDAPLGPACGPRRVRGRLRAAHSAPQARYRPVLGYAFQMIAECESTG